MSKEISSRIEFEQLARKIHSVVQQHFTCKFDPLRQAICAGYGSKSHAAMISKLNNGEPINLEKFDHLAFIARLQGMGFLSETILAINSIIDGRRLKISIDKLPDNPKYSNTSYNVQVEATHFSGESVNESFFFIVPTFGGLNGVGDKYRVDSAYNYRHSSKFSVSRYPDGRGLLTVEGNNGRWGGGMFIYDFQHQQDDSSCKQAVRAALARKILVAVSPRFNIQLYKPDGYDTGAWRLRVSLGDEVRSYLGTTPLVLSIPAQDRRRFLPDNGYRRDINLMHFENGLLEAHVYSNGIPENENPTPIEDVYLVMVKSMHQTLDQLGFESLPFWAK
ncbi:hypothetical protein H5A44_00015 [Pectobacterium brasiliense]|uniref:hypothetical protein n=1 Tax=Pectobacterium brasiliense TaxID=180957 RepID=UPI00196A05AE|nr:hypothetical protein [Pectobacterium brasiliense]MBN3340817.1 hypothetical protein [Pectobacterium brasiliense]